MKKFYEIQHEDDDYDDGTEDGGANTDWTSGW